MKLNALSTSIACLFFALLSTTLFTTSLYGHGIGTTTRIEVTGGWWYLYQVHEIIDDVVISVVSYDMPTQRLVNKPIINFRENLTNCYFKLSFDEALADDIRCTPTQEFYVPVQQKWLPACQLDLDDELLTMHGTTIAITRKEFIKEPLLVFSLEIKDTHTFFIGRYSLLTHNMIFPLAAHVGCSVAFGSGAAAGAAAGSFFGPVTFIGGFAIGGLIALSVKAFHDQYKATHYALEFNHADVENIIHQQNAHRAGKISNQKSDVKSKEKNLPQGGKYPFKPKKRKDGKIPRDKRGGFIDSNNNSWRWDHKKQEWDVQINGGEGHLNINIYGNITH